MSVRHTSGRRISQKEQQGLLMSATVHSLWAFWFINQLGIWLEIWVMKWAILCCYLQQLDTILQGSVMFCPMACVSCSWQKAHWSPAHWSPPAVILKRSILTSLACTSWCGCCGCTWSSFALEPCCFAEQATSLETGPREETVTDACLGHGKIQSL